MAVGDAGRPAAATRPLLKAGSTYWLLLAVACALLVVGLVMVLSASAVFALARQGDSTAYFKRQLLWVGAGVLVMLVVSHIDYRSWRPPGHAAAGRGRRGLVLRARPPRRGVGLRLDPLDRPAGRAHRQPAEFAKLALLLFLGRRADPQEPPPR